MNGVGSFIEAAFLFSIVVLAIAGIIALIHSKERTSPPKPFTSGEIFMRRLLIIGMLVVFTGVVLAGVNNIKDRWLQPVLFLLPAATAAWFSHYRAGGNALRDFARVSIVAALIVPPVLGYYLTYGSSTPPYGQLDYQRLYDEVKQHGAFKTILTDNAQIPEISAYLIHRFRSFIPKRLMVRPMLPDPLWSCGLEKQRPMSV